MAKPTAPHIALEATGVPWLLAAAFATSAPHAPHQPIWLVVLCFTALLWRTLLWQRDAPLPPRWLLLLVMLAGVAAITAHYRTLFGRDAGVALLILLMAGKPLETRARRDAIVIVMLGFFLLLTHYFYSQSIATGGWLLATLTLLTATLIRLHGGAQPWQAPARLAGTLLIQALPLMIILFLLFPRVQGPLWGLPRDAYAGLTGLSETMAPGSLNNLIQSGSIAFRVKFNGAIPPPAERYWRGPVLEDYDGRSWSRAPSAQRSATLAARLAPGRTTYRYETTLEAHNQRWLLALDLPFDLPPDSVLSSRFEALSRDPLHNRARFILASTSDAQANRDEAPATLKRALFLPPETNPRSYALAKQWQSQYADAQAISAAALRFFRQEAFYYTLHPPLTGENAVDDFLFTTRRGFCEHYASAYVVLMRAADIPARVITGYQGGEINPIDGFLTVRQSDAHAWAEIWLAGRGWIRVDPTAAVAPARVEQGIEAALPVGEALPALVRIDSDWLRRVRYRWEATNNAWNQWVLGYNPERQREALTRLGLGTPDWRTLTAMLATLCGAALLTLSAWILYRRPRLAPEQRAWRQFCAALARHGVKRSDWEGPQALAERTANERPHLAALTARATQAYTCLRYGPCSLRERAKAQKDLEECTRALARQRITTATNRRSGT